jgi:hypothetical protein
VILAGVIACGPSFQTIYENDARFEHCYAIDEGTTSLGLKAACWKDWKEHHTLGQTRDRVEYAQSRYIALASNALPTDEGMMQAAPGEVGERNQLTAPAPTNPFAPPEAMMTQDASARIERQPIPMATATASASTGGIEDAGANRPPGAVCTEDCVSSWDTCKRGHDARACDGVYSRCIVGCVKH